MKFSSRRLGAGQFYSDRQNKCPALDNSCAV